MPSEVKFNSVNQPNYEKKKDIPLNKLIKRIVENDL